MGGSGDHEDRGTTPEPVVGKEFPHLGRTGRPEVLWP